MRPRPLNCFIVLLSLGSLLVFPSISRAGSEPDDFLKAQNENSLVSWDEYLGKHPVGLNVSRAREAFDAILLEQASRAKTDPATLETLHKKCKSAEGADKIWTLWDDALFDAAKTSQSSADIRKYLILFPGGRHVSEAKTTEEAIAWRQAQKFQTKEAYAEFLQQHSSGDFAATARKAIDDIEYDSVRKTDTVEAYEVFLRSHYGHDEATKRLRELRYQKAVSSGDLADWLVFFDQYKHNRGKDTAKLDEQMTDNAKKEVERLMFEKILTEPTLDLCEGYLRRFAVFRPSIQRTGFPRHRSASEDSHVQQVRIRMEPCLFEAAARTNTAAGYFKYLNKYPEGYRDKDIRKSLEALLFVRLDKNESFRDFETYLRLYPKEEEYIKSRMEPFIFSWAKEVNTMDAFKRYLSTYSNDVFAQQSRSFRHTPTRGDKVPVGTNSVHDADIRRLLDPLLYKNAADEDWYSTYEEYVRVCPNGANVEKAKERLTYLKGNTAQVEVDYPKQLEQPGGRWSWVTTFRETGGKVGFKVTGSGNIYDAKGGRWGVYGGSIGRGTITVKPGGKGTDDYWCGNSGAHTWCNGYASFSWTGEDAGGHPINLEARVSLIHKGCTGEK